MYLLQERRSRRVAARVATRAVRDSACMEENEKHSVGAMRKCKKVTLSLNIIFDVMCGKHENVSVHLENQT